MPRPAEHTMERRHVNAVSAASQVDIGNVIDPATDTRNGMAGEISRKDTLSKKQTWKTRSTSHARRISKSGDVMDQKCTEKPTEATGEWRIQYIEPIC